MPGGGSATNLCRSWSASCHCLSKCATSAREPPSTTTCSYLEKSCCSTDSIVLLIPWGSSLVIVTIAVRGVHGVSSGLTRECRAEGPLSVEPVPTSATFLHNWHILLSGAAFDYSVAHRQGPGETEGVG